MAQFDFEVSMLRFLVGAVLIMNSTLHAVTVVVEDPCGSSLWLHVKQSLPLPQSVGQISIEVFQKAKLAFEGSHYGINQIKNTPQGLEAIEVLSQQDMRAYGWCFRLDGQLSPQLASDEIVTQQNARLVWFYGYADYREGIWQDYCVPSAPLKPPFLCQ